MRIALQIAASVTLIIFSAYGTNKGIAVQTQPKTLALTQVGQAYPGAEILRVAHRNGGGVLIVSHTEDTAMRGSRTTFAALDLKSSGGPWKTEETIQQLLPVIPVWDAGYNAEGQLQVLHEEAGGAVNALMLDVHSKQKTVSDPSSLHSFSLPRFVKSSGKAATWGTAVVDNESCEAMALEGGKVHALGACVEGLLVEVPAGFILLSKEYASGLVRGNDIARGHLRAALLTREFQPSGAAVDVVGETVFQFDAEVVDGKLVCVATTPEGLVVASTGLSGLHFSGQHYSASTTLVYPAVLSAAAGKVVVFALEGAGSGGAHVVAAQVAIP